MEMLIYSNAVKLATKSTRAVFFVSAATKALLKTNKIKPHILQAASRKAHKYLRKHRSAWIAAQLEALNPFKRRKSNKGKIWK